MGIASTGMTHKNYFTNNVKDIETEKNINFLPVFFSRNIEILFSMFAKMCEDGLFVKKVVTGIRYYLIFLIKKTCCVCYEV